MNDRFNNAVGPQVRTRKRRPGKLIPALATLTLGGGLQASTQFFAHDMRYQAALGPHIDHIYVPWGIVQWASKWYSHYPDAFMRAGSVGITVAGIGLIGLVVAKMVASNTSKANEYLHGSARWANKKDIQDAGLLPQPRKWHEIVRGVQAAKSSGVYVGAWVDKSGKLHYLRHDGPEHVLTYAPTRCLAAGTRIHARVDGIIGNPTIAELAGIDPARVQLWAGSAWTQLRWCERTRVAERALEIYFANGEVVHCTANHIWPTAEAGEIRADQLLVHDNVPVVRLPGDEHEPAPGAGEVVAICASAEREFFDLEVADEPHLFALASGILTHNSGKGVGLVVPTLLSWNGSALVTDLKGELWAMTAGWRQKYAKNKVLRFEPADPNCDVFINPMEEIRLGTGYEVGDVQNLATLLVDPDGKGLETHWQKTSQALLVGLILHALYKSKNEGTPANLPHVDFLLADPNRSVAELWMEMVTYGHVNGQNHPAVGSAARDMMDRPEEEAGSVLSTAKSYLALYRDPVVARNVSRSNFRIKDLMNHESPVSLYIVTQPNDKARLRPLVRVIINQVVRLLADKMEFERITAEMPWWRRLLATIGISQAETTYVRTKKNYKHRLLGMIDEFPSLGKLEILQESLAFVAGYGIKFYLICQDINQLKSRETGYGPDETITSNCHVQNAYPPNRVETAEHLSKLTGTTTVAKEQITTSGRRTSALLGQVSRTIQEVQRPLLTPDECLRMPGPKKDRELIVEPGDMVVYVAGYPAIYGRQPLYFQDPIFTARAAVSAPHKSDELRPVKIRQPEGSITI